MDFYLQSLVEARKDTMASLKSALANVTSLIELVNSLNNQISARNSTNRLVGCHTDCLDISNSTNLVTSASINNNEMLLLLPTDNNLQSESQTTSVTHVASAPEFEVRDKPSELDTSQIALGDAAPKDLNILNCGSEVTNIKQENISESNNDIAAFEEDILRPEKPTTENTQEISPKQTSPSRSLKRSLRFQPTVRLEVLQNLFNGERVTKKRGRRRKRNPDEIPLEERIGYERKKRQNRESYERWRIKRARQYDAETNRLEFQRGKRVSASCGTKTNDEVTSRQKTHGYRNKRIV